MVVYSGGPPALKIDPWPGIAIHVIGAQWMSLEIEKGRFCNFS